MSNNIPYTPKMMIAGLRLFLDGNSFKAIKEELGISTGQRIVIRGLHHFNRKYDLRLERDRDSSIGYIVKPTDKDRIREALKIEEIEANSEFLNTPIHDTVQPEPLVQIIEDIHKERMELIKQMDKLNDKIRFLEKYLKSKMK